MKEKLAKLIDVKSIITILLTIVFGALTLKGTVSEAQFVDIFKTIIIFYFGTQAIKKSIDTTKE